LHFYRCVVLSKGDSRTLREVQEQEQGEQAEKTNDTNDEEQEIAKMRTQLDTIKNAYAEEKKHSEDYLTRLKYLQADYDNLRKRTEKRIDDIKKYSNETLVCSLLEVSDELELALKTARGMGNSEALVEGVEMTLKKLYKIMDKEGVSPIICNLSALDPSKHEVVEKVERDDLDDGTIVDEIRKGYMMKDKVIRPSRVKVAIKPSKLKDNGEKSHEQ